VLTITVPGLEVFSETADEFIEYEDTTLTLEHSLISLSKWEQFYQKPFLTDKGKSTDEIIDYVKFMCITRGVSDDVFRRLTDENVKDIQEYLDARMTATWFSDPPGSIQSARGEVITAELIYYWMITFNIPFECEKWHLNRLIALIRVCNIKNSPPKKMGRAETVAWQREQNERRRKALGTRG
jgi:hypothetical protein